MNFTKAELLESVTNTFLRSADDRVWDNFRLADNSPRTGTRATLALSRLRRLFGVIYPLFAFAEN
jgi:hypothetical protein